jgi:hypothetical protein
MKKIVTLLAIMLITISTFAQTNLFKGIKSGMTKTEFMSYCSSNPDFKIIESDNDFITTEIEGRTYIFTQNFNSKGQLYSLMFYSSSRYEWMEYDPNVKENAVELYSLLEVKYGEPTYDVWVNWTDIPEGKSEIACSFEKNTVVAIILITEYKEEYFIGLTIIDSKYKDIVVKDSGGF